MSLYAYEIGDPWAELEIRNAWNLAKAGRIYTEDGAMQRVETLRHFDITRQSEPGYLGELREPFASDTMRDMLADMCEEEPS